MDSNLKQTVISRLRLLQNAILDAVFPGECVICRVAGLNATPICENCQKLLRVLMAGPACPRCGTSIGPHGVQNGRCHACRHSRVFVDHLVRIGPYVDPISTIVRAFKYGGRDEYDIVAAEPLAEIMELTPWFEDIEALVCVPTHWRRILGKPHYAPQVLIRALSRLTGLPVAPVLRRTATGPHQFDVPLPQRRANVSGKFSILGLAGVRGARLCLVDDVATTGATVNECARVLKQAGATSVCAAVIAKVNTGEYFPDDV